MVYVFIGISCIIAGGIVSLFFRPERKAFALLPAIVGGSLFFCIGGIQTLVFQIKTDWSLPFSQIFGTVRLSLDPLSAFFLMLIAIGSIPGLLGGLGYMRQHRKNGGEKAAPDEGQGVHWLVFSLFIASMALVVTVQNVLAFLIVWEIMSLSSFFLLFFDHLKEEVYKAAIKYLVAMHVGLVCIIASFLLPLRDAANYDFLELSRILKVHQSLVLPSFILALAGFGTKAGIVPFHTWLPSAHPASPAHVSAMMSGVMIKMGIYGILRFLILSGSSDLRIAGILCGAGILTLLYGASETLVQKDIKGLLAYCSIENIGIIVTALGIGMAGRSLSLPHIAAAAFLGAILHTLNHSLFKAVLFNGAGAVYQMTHTRNMELLGGLFRFMPKTGFLFLVGSAAITGLPPFSGFVSEYLIYSSLIGELSALNGGMRAAAVITMTCLAFAGAVSLASFSKAFGISFLGNPRSDTKGVREAPIPSLIAMAIPALLCLLVGIFPVYAVKLIAPAAGFLCGNGPETGLMISDTLSRISLLFCVFLALCFLLLLLRFWLLKGKRVVKVKTWDCGYQRGTGRIQYSGASFIEPLASLIRPQGSREKDLDRPEGFFPEKAGLVSSYRDPVEAFLVRPLTNALRKLLSFFWWIQIGETRLYILYGFLFLVAALILVLGGRP